MTGRPSKRKLFRDDSGAVALMAAALMLPLLGLVGLGVDLGILYAARSQLQNAADASALAAAATMIAIDPDDQAVAQPSVALDTAKQFASANKALGVSLQLRDQDFTIGFWDQALGDFDPARTGFSSDPDDLTAVRVVLRRDALMNSPVSTVFAKAVGLNEVGLQARSTAFLGWAGALREGQADLPIAVHAGALTGGDGPLCGQSLLFHSENDENVSWTTFFLWPTNDPNVQSYVTGATPIPALSVGDTINLINGNLSQNTFQALYDRFIAETGGPSATGPREWPVVLPVVNPGGDSTSASVAGFARMVITDVRLAPSKDVVGYLSCGYSVPGSPTGGGDYGLRAARPVLIR